MSSYVLDSSAVLALLNEEPGAYVVEAIMTEDAALSTVNLAEIVSRLVDKGFSDDAIDQAIRRLDVTVWDFDSAQSHATGRLRAETRAFGLSLGDRACLSLARILGRVALTADRSWVDVPGVEVELIR